MIKNFLMSGSLEGLSLGSSEAEVRSLLGEAEARSQKKKRTEIWKYGGLQVAFYEGAVSFIGLYFDNGTVVLPSTLSAGGLVRIEESRLEDVKSFLSANNIGFVEDENLTFDEQACLRVTQSGVGICFIQDELHSLQLSKDAVL